MIIRFIKLISVFLWILWIFQSEIILSLHLKPISHIQTIMFERFLHDLQISWSYFKFVFFERNWTVRFAAYIWHRTQLVDLDSGVRDPALSGILKFFKCLIPICVSKQMLTSWERETLRTYLKDKLEPSISRKKNKLDQPMIAFDCFCL